MIELMFILIILTILFFIWFIQKIIILTQKITLTNNAISKIPFKGNISEFKLTLKILNQKLNKMFKENKKNQDAATLGNILNLIFLFFFNFWLFLKKRKKSIK